MLPRLPTTTSARENAVDPHWLMSGDVMFRLLALGAALLPAVLILLSRRCRWYFKLPWMLATQLHWAFPLTYAWIWTQRYGGGMPTTPVPLEDAYGWWMLAYPWAVYLLYRATRRHFAPKVK